MERVLQPEDKPEASDRELLERCRAGDETAFDDLVLRHQQRAFNVAFQVLQDYEDSMEVAQDAFVRIYRNVDNFRWECEFTTWLHQIVVNLARNRYRWWKRRGKQASISLDNPVKTTDGEVPLQIIDTSDTPDVLTIKSEFVELLSRRMEELPDDFRQVLILRNVDNLSYEQIADMLNCSIGTIKSRISRARQMLRESMKDDR